MARGLKCSLIGKDIPSSREGDVETLSSHRLSFKLFSSPAVVHVFIMSLSKGIPSKSGFLIRDLLRDSLL